jgi:DNA-binding response OmpR family regulator
MACFLPPPALPTGIFPPRTRGRPPPANSTRGRDFVSKDATILVVDDNEDNAEILRAYLESRGYAVAVAPDGRTALAKLEDTDPDLILLDVMMPGMDGWEVCRTIKNHPDFNRIRVIMVTAKGAWEDKHEGMRSGADDYLVKPVDLEELSRRVERNLAQGRERS